MHEPPLTVAEQRRRHASGAVAVTTTIGRCLDRIERLDPAVHAFMSVDRERAMRRAAELDAALARGEAPGPLHGVAVAVKDNMDVAGWIGTCGSIVRADHRADRTAPCVAALEAAGAVLVGSTMMDEWAFGGSTENPHFGRVANPWDPGRTTGGSSGGSAAAVAAGLVPIALGTDTGGSVRLPAALCGVVGFKPTLGRLSLEGIEPLAPTYDTLGVFAQYVDDALAWLSVLDPSVRVDERPARLLYPADLPRTDPAIVGAFERALSACVRAGIQVDSEPVPWLWEIPDHFRPVVLSELAGRHADRPERSRYGQPLQESIRQGERVDAATYAAALAFRDRVRERFADLLGGDEAVALVTPMTARPADPCGVSFDDAVRWPDGSEEDYFAVSTRFTLFANVLGAPAVTVPIAGGDDGLPVGFQLVGLPGEDGALLGTAARLQRLLGGPLPPPPLADPAH